MNNAKHKPHSVPQSVNTGNASLTKSEYREIIRSVDYVVADQEEEVGLPGCNRWLPSCGSHSTTGQQDDLRATSGMYERGDANLLWRAPKNKRLALDTSFLLDLDEDVLALTFSGADLPVAHPVHPKPLLRPMR